jgi:hypothetical protein
MRRIVAATLSVWIAFGLFVAFSSDAQAVVGYDSQYVGESAFIDLLPGQTGSFTVFFANTGSTSWIRGSGTQVNLAACLDNKTTCNVAPEEAAFNDGSWYSTTAYATQVQPRVDPNTIGTFTYRVKAPTSITVRTLARFNGDLALASSGAMIHQEGYYQDANVNGSNAGGGGGTGAAISCTAGDGCGVVAGLASSIVYAARDFLRAVSGLIGSRA